MFFLAPRSPLPFPAPDHHNHIMVLSLGTPGVEWTAAKAVIKGGLGFVSGSVVGSPPGRSHMEAHLGQRQASQARDAQHAASACSAHSRMGLTVSASARGVTRRLTGGTRRKARSRRRSLTLSSGVDDDDEFCSDGAAHAWWGADGWADAGDGFGSSGGGNGWRGGSGDGGGSGWFRSNYGGEPFNNAFYEGMWVYQLICFATLLQAGHFLHSSVKQQGAPGSATGMPVSC